VFGLNKEDLGTQGSLSCKEDIGLRLGTYMQQILSVTVRICKEILQQMCVSHVNLLMGYVVGKLTASGAASVCTLQSVLSVLNSLHLRFSSLYSPGALLPKETLNTGFRVIRYAFI
jgi:hypothetical protein